MGCLSDPFPGSNCLHVAVNGNAVKRHRNDLAPTVVIRGVSSSPAGDDIGAPTASAASNIPSSICFIA